MSNLFDDRERAEEYGFAHGQELRFLAARDGARALADWTSERMPTGDGYAASLVDALLEGGPGAVATRATRDLAGAGRSEAAAEVQAVLERVTAQAYARLHDVARVAPSALQAEPRPATAHHTHGFWGWDT